MSVSALTVEDLATNGAHTYSDLACMSYPSVLGFCPQSESADEYRDTIIAEEVYPGCITMTTSLAGISGPYLLLTSQTKTNSLLWFGSTKLRAKVCTLQFVSPIFASPPFYGGFVVLSVVIDVDQDTEWIKLNVDEVGYYRVNYTMDGWKMFENLLRSQHTVCKLQLRVLFHADRESILISFSPCRSSQWQTERIFWATSSI